MITNNKIKLIHEFLQRENIKPLFEYFLEVKNIKPSKVKEIIKTLEHEDE